MKKVFPTSRGFFSGFRLRAAPILVLAMCLNCLGGVPKTLPLPPNVESVQARDLKRHLSFLASPELGGRYTLSLGNRIAARYLAAQLESYGFRGAMPDGSFLQNVPFSIREIDVSKTKITVGVGSEAFVYGNDFVGNLEIDRSVDVPAEMVFVGHGVSSPENGIDDFKGLNVRGKIVVYLPQLPKDLTSRNLPERSFGLGAATAKGCAAAIQLPNLTPEIWQSIKAAYGSGKRAPKPAFPTDDEPDAHSSSSLHIVAGPTLANRIFHAMRLSPETIRRDMAAGKRIKPGRVRIGGRIQIAVPDKPREQAQNVVGILDGRDPILKNEYIVLSSHYDHLETDGKTVYPGADDDGSGTAAVLEIARAFGAGERPKRSVVVLFNTGEELGLYGSAYFVDHPPVPLSQIVANFNIDMIGRSRAPNDTNPENARLADRDTVYLIGPDKHSSELNQISEQTNTDVTGFKLDYTYNNENDPSRLFYRSDHWNFARKGIPVIFYFNGLHADYHKSTDTIDKIDFEKMARVTRLVYGTSWRVANLDARLKLDRWNASSN